MPVIRLLAVAACDEPPAAVVPVGDPDAFTVVVLPDTQIYAWLYPETFEAQTRWIAENKDTERIVFVTHVGDIVETGTAAEEWANAQAAWDWIEDAGIPHGFSAGAHDFRTGGVTGRDTSCANFDDIDCDFTEYPQNFGPKRYEGREWFVGARRPGTATRSASRRAG